MARKQNTHVNICWLMSSVIRRWLYSTRSSEDFTSSAFLCSAINTAQCWSLSVWF